MIATRLRRLSAVASIALAFAGYLCFSASAQASPALDLETLSATEEEKLFQEGKVSSVELVKGYLARIKALNKAGPDINGVTQINPDVFVEAEKADRERAEGKNLGPAMGLPILLKDIIDSTPMYTTAGDWALRESFPEKDSGVAKELKAHGVVILGKAGLSEWANSFGSQPSGFGNVTGQVLNANDAAQGPSGSSSGSGADAAAALAALTIGTETGGSIISPSTAENVVGIRPTLGLVPGYGISPIDASRDTAGPIDRTVADAAATLDSIAEVTGTDKEANEEYEAIMGPEFLKNGDIQPAPYTKLPDFTEALKLNYVKGKRIGYNGTTCTVRPPETSCTPTPTQEATLKAKEVLEEAGAIMVPDEPLTTPAVPPLPSGYEPHATIDDYYKHLGSHVPVKSLKEEVEVDETDPQEALKYGNRVHASEAEVEDTPGGANQQAYDKVLPEEKKVYHETIEKMMNEPSGGGGPVIAVLGSVPNGPAAGDPEITVPMGYSTTQRRSVNIDINGGAYDDMNLIGVGYVLEEMTKLHKPPAEIDPSMYRCSKTVPLPPFAARGHCNPDYESIMKMLGGKPALLPFTLEGASAKSLESKLTAGTLTSVALVKAELYRMALANADGPGIQAIRALNPNVLTEAAEADRLRAHHAPEGPLAGIPVLVDDSMDVSGLATSGDSIALENEIPHADAALVTELRQAGALILGDTNTGELGGVFSPTMPQGYSSLGGQVLLPSDTNKSVGGSSGGSAAAVSAGFAPLAIGLEASTEAAQLIAPAGNAGLVALKPTVGLVSSAGVMPVAESQDAPGPMGDTVNDVATTLGIITGKGPTAYTAGLTGTALSGKKIAVVSSTTAPYPEAVAKLTALGATTGVVEPGAGTTAPSVIPYEFHKDIDSFLGSMPGPGPKSLAQVIAYNKANPVEGLKFGQPELEAAEEVNYADSATRASYEADLSQGQSEDRAVIDGILAGGYSAIMVPSGSPLVGIADRAGYPVLTVPAGYGAENSSTGGDPIGVEFIGTADSEAELLADGFAFERGMNAALTGPLYMQTAANFETFSGTPSEVDQSMWRCIAGSEFFDPYDCNPGELTSTACMVEGKGSCVKAPPAPPSPPGRGGHSSPSPTPYGRDVPGSPLHGAHLKLSLAAKRGNPPPRR